MCIRDKSNLARPPPPPLQPRHPAWLATDALGESGPHKEWFKRLVVTRDGVDAVELAVKKTQDGDMQIKVQGEPVPTLWSLWTDREKVATRAAAVGAELSLVMKSQPGESEDQSPTVSVTVGNLTIHVTTRENAHKVAESAVALAAPRSLAAPVTRSLAAPVTPAVHVVPVAPVAPVPALAAMVAATTKHRRERAAAAAAQRKEVRDEDLHLNFFFASEIPDDASGLLAELAGVRPMSKATEEMLKKPTVLARAVALSAPEASSERSSRPRAAWNPWTKEHATSEEPNFQKLTRQIKAAYGWDMM